MHIGQQFSPRLVDERHFLQANADLLIRGRSLLPASLQFFNPRSR
jgi:hypothetical protein